MGALKYAVLAGIGSVGYALYRALSKPQNPLAIQAVSFALTPRSVVVGSSKGSSASISANGNILNTGGLASPSLYVSLDAFLNNGFLRAGTKTGLFIVQPGEKQLFSLSDALVYSTDLPGTVTGVVRLWDKNGNLLATKTSGALAVIEAPVIPTPTQQVSGVFSINTRAPAWDAGISGYEYWGLAGIAVNNGNVTTTYAFHLESEVYNESNQLVQQFDDPGVSSWTLAPGASNDGNAVSVIRSLTPTAGWYTRARGRLDAISPEAKRGLAYTAWTTHSY